MTDPAGERLTRQAASLLAVLAHPDDEAFRVAGTLALYASRGVRVTLACATRGEAGRILDPELGQVEDLAALREAELRLACNEIGISPPVFLGYRDSGYGPRLRRDDPLASANANLWEIEDRVLELIDQTRPQVMLTFDPHGVYGHPDHLVIHRAASAAFHSSGHLEHPPSRLFYVAVTSDELRGQRAGGIAGPSDPDPLRFGVSESTLAVRLDIRALADRKRAAMSAHRSQTGPLSAVSRYPAAVLERLYSTEGFSLGGTRGPLTRWPLAGLFDGLGFPDLDAGA